MASNRKGTDPLHPRLTHALVYETAAASPQRGRKKGKGTKVVSFCSLSHQSECGGITEAFFFTRKSPRGINFPRRSAAVRCPSPTPRNSSVSRSTRDAFVFSKDATPLCTSVEAGKVGQGARRKKRKKQTKKGERSANSEQQPPDGGGQRPRPPAAARFKC